MYKLFLTLRYLRKRRIAWFAVLACTLCVWMVLTVTSVMGGFLDTLKQRARGLLGDLIVDNRSFGGFPLYDEFIADVGTWRVLSREAIDRARRQYPALDEPAAGVVCATPAALAAVPELAAAPPVFEQATPVIYSFGLIRFPQSEQTSTVRVVGIRLEEVYRVNAFAESLYYNRFYPESTHLGDQQQPLVGAIAPPEPERKLLLALPSPLREALDRSRAAGLTDPDKSDSDVNQELQRQGEPPIPGIYAPNFVEIDESHLAIGEPAWTGDPLPGIIIGRDIVATRLPEGNYDRYGQYPRGCPVTVTLIPVSLTASIDTPIKQAFRYADDSRTGIYEIDSQHVYCDFELLQQLLLMDPAERPEGAGMAPARCSQIQFKLSAAVDATVRERVCGAMRTRYRAMADRPEFDLRAAERSLVARVDAYTWEQSQAHVIAPVEKERFLVTMLFGVISLVAVVLVLCILYMIVLQKTRDIGIVKSIGGSSAGVACVFVLYGLSVGVLGATLGVVLGVLFVTNINEVQAALIWISPGLRVWDRSVYSFDEIPHRVAPEDVAAVVIAALIACTIGSLAAAWRAGRMQPVEALRYE